MQKNVLTDLLDKVPKDYKFCVNSTLLQHNESTPVEGSDEFAQNAGRGMHCASGSFWDKANDGMWVYKLEGGGKREFDTVVSIIWIKIVV